MVAGIVGLVIAAVWWFVYKNPPQEILAVTTAQRSEVRSSEQRAFGWGELFRTRSLWGVLLIRMISDPVWYFCCFWLPAYLRDIYRMQDAALSMQDTLDRIQWIGGIPFLVGAVGGVLSSVWSDRMVRRGSDSLAARKRMMIATVVVAPLCMLVPYLNGWIADAQMQVAVVVAIFSLIAVMCLSWLYTICVVIAEAFPVRNVASGVGITAGAGAVGGAVFNIFVGDMLASMGDVLFIIMGMLHIAAAVILWRMVRRETPLT